MPFRILLVALGVLFSTSCARLRQQKLEEIANQPVIISGKPILSKKPGDKCKTGRSQRDICPPDRKPAGK